jgi:hypothetical protein
MHLPSPLDRFTKFHLSVGDEDTRQRLLMFAAVVAMTAILFVADAFFHAALLR